MSGPFANLVGVETASVVMRAAHHFSTRRRQSGPARLSSVCLPGTFDAPFSGCSGLPSGAVGGFFFHALSVFFLPLLVSPNHP